MATPSSVPFEMPWQLGRLQGEHLDILRRHKLARTRRQRTTLTHLHGSAWNVLTPLHHTRNPDSLCQQPCICS